MKIISWNCCSPPWSLTKKKRLPLFIPILIEENQDIICLQEVFSEKDSRYIAQELDQKNYHYSFHFKDLLIISKLPFMSKAGYIFKTQGDLFSWAILDRLYGKGYQVIDVINKDRRVTILNTHLLSAYAFSGDRYQKVRTQQTSEICQTLKGGENSKIIVGDFNFEPGTEPYKLMIGNGYKDSFQEDLKALKNRRLDYIFTKDINNFKAKVVLDLKNKLSDHVTLSVVF